MVLIAEVGNQLQNLPTWSTIINEYGPYLGSFVFFIILVVWLQWYWYKQNIVSKNEEIGRLVKRTTELEQTNSKLINQMRSSKK